MALRHIAILCAALLLVTTVGALERDLQLSSLPDPREIPIREPLPNSGCTTPEVLDRLIEQTLFCSFGEYAGGRCRRDPHFHPGDWPSPQKGLTTRYLDNEENGLAPTSLYDHLYYQPQTGGN